MNNRILAAVGITIIIAAGALMMRSPDVAPPSPPPAEATPAKPEARHLKPQRIAKPPGIQPVPRGPKDAKPRKSSEAMIAELSEAYERIHDPSSPENVFARSTAERVKGWVAIIDDPEFADLPRETRKELRAISKQGASISAQVARGELTVAEGSKQMANAQQGLRKAVSGAPDEMVDDLTDAFGSDLAPPQNMFAPGEWEDAAWPTEAGAP